MPLLRIVISMMMFGEDGLGSIHRSNPFLFSRCRDEASGGGGGREPSRVARVYRRWSGLSRYRGAGLKKGFAILGLCWRLRREWSARSFWAGNWGACRRNSLRFGCHSSTSEARLIMKEGR